MYYTQIRANAIAERADRRARRHHDLHGDARTDRVPDLPDVRSGADRSAHAAAQSAAGAQHHDPGRRRRDFYKQQFASYGLNFDPARRTIPTTFVNPRSQVTSIGAEREIARGLFAGADYVHQHWANLDRTVDLNAPTPFDRTAPGQSGQSAAANATRPIVPVNGGVRTVNVLMNLGHRRLRRPADARQLSRQPEVAGGSELHAVEGDQHDRAGRQRHRSERLRTSRASARKERGPSVVDQRHRAVITFSYNLPYNITAGTVTQLASARPFNATTGIDNNGDGANNDRPVVNGAVIGKSAFRGTGTQDVGAVRRGPGQAEPAAASCCGSRASTCSTTATSWAARRRPTATRRRSTRRSARLSPSGRPPTRCRAWPTSTRRGCSSSRSGTSSNLVIW